MINRIKLFPHLRHDSGRRFGPEISRSPSERNFWITSRWVGKVFQRGGFKKFAKLSSQNKMSQFLDLQKSPKGTSKQTERVNMHKVRLSVEEFHDTGHDWQSELLFSGSLPAKLPTQNVKFVNGIFSDSITNSKVRHLEFKTKSQCVLCYCSDM